MKLFRTVGRIAKPFVNFPKWMGVSKLLQNAKDIKALAGDVIYLQKSNQRETFEVAVARLGLDENQLKKREKQFWWLALFFVLLGVLALSVACYHLWLGHHMAVVIAVILSGIAFAQAFRNHFWYFQTREKQLGAQWHEWVHFVLGKRS